MAEATISTAGYRPSVGRFKKPEPYRADPMKFVTDGRCATDIADDVFRALIRQWGFAQSDEAERRDFMNSLAYALSQGTSASRDYPQIHVPTAQGLRDLGALSDICAEKIGRTNAVRLWAKSINGGELAVLTMCMLMNPENVEMRTRARADYGVENEVVHLCFDYADALVDAGVPLTSYELSIIRRNTSLKVGESRSNIVGATDGGSVAGLSAGSMRSSVPVQSTTAQAASGASEGMAFPTRAAR